MGGFMKKQISKKRQAKTSKAPKVSAPFLSEEFIEAAAYSYVRLRNEAVSLPVICEEFEAKLGFKVVYSSKISAALGEVDFRSLVVTIFVPGYGEHLQRFALAYCIGHIALGHGDYIDSAVCYESTVTIVLKDRTSEAAASSLEWQAKYFSSSLLMPAKMFGDFFLELKSALDIKDRGKGPIYLDDQNCNKALYARIVSEVRGCFKVPSPLVIFRIKALKLLTDARRPLRVKGNVIEDAIHAMLR